MRARSRFPVASVMIGTGMSGPTSQPLMPSKTRLLSRSGSLTIHVRWFGALA